MTAATEHIVVLTYLYTVLKYLQTYVLVDALWLLRGRAQLWALIRSQAPLSPSFSLSHTQAERTAREFDAI